MNFIHNEWKENHILSRSKEFFLYEHQDKTNINFVISINNNDQIDGLLGFIPSSFNAQVDIFTVIWKVSKNNGDAVLGIKLLEYLTNLNKFRTVMSVGINEKTIGIYKFLQFFTGTLNHYVLINSNLSVHKIATIPKQNIELYNFIQNENYIIKVLERDFKYDFSIHINNIPFKDEQYFKKRYFDHPIYQYQVYGIFKKKSLSSLVVTRIQTAEDSAVLRIVDYVGDEQDFKYVSGCFFQILSDNKLEYADFYSYGFDHSELSQAGFIKIDQELNELIIPNYFHPFLKKNIKINFFSNTSHISSLKLFKADGDQDRPN